MLNKERIQQLEAQLGLAMNICRKLIGADTSDAVAKEFDDLEQEIHNNITDIHKKSIKTKKHYVTFGQNHIHRINGITLDCDTVACYNAVNAEAGRQLAFDTFKDKFFTDYHDKAFNMESLKYFPKGIVNID